jgi:hypothetical protein
MDTIARLKQVIYWPNPMIRRKEGRKEGRKEAK